MRQTLTKQFWAESSWSRKLIAVCALIVSLGAALGTIYGASVWAEGRIDTYIALRVEQSAWGDSLMAITARIDTVSRDSVKHHEFDTLKSEIAEIKISQADMKATLNLIVDLVKQQNARSR